MLIGCKVKGAWSGYDALFRERVALIEVTSSSFSESTEK